MDKMCLKSESEDINKTMTNIEEAENAKRCESPVFKCVNQTKPVRENNLDSSECDLPSYQLNLSAKTAMSKTSSKLGSDTNETGLPFSPIFPPTPLPPTSQFQPPFIRSLETVVKNLNKCPQNRGADKETQKPTGIFETLGMTSKDISWVSSMASPPPKVIPGSQFNTVEKATFLPEEKFQSIQPRALFSPTLDEDFGCHPISSESDDDDVYKSSIRLSDVCATLKKLEFKSLDPGSVKKISPKDESPVIRAKKRKLDNVKKKKGILVLSPENKYEFSIGTDLRVLDYDKAKDGNFIEDDSFQSMSFTCIDELCKTLASSDCDKTIVNSKPNFKKFYSTRVCSEVHAVTSLDDLHSYVKALEEGDKSIPESGKIYKEHAVKGIVRFDILNNSLSVDSESKHFQEKTEEENSGWEKVKQYLSESQLNVSDSEIFKTLENLEKTLASQESKDMEKWSCSGGGDCEQDAKDALSESLNISKAPIEDSGAVEKPDSRNESHQKLHFGAFTTASGMEIPVSVEALNKAREILKDCENDEIAGECVPVTVTKAFKPREKLKNLLFSTTSTNEIQVSAESLQKAKTLMLECDVETRNHVTDASGNEPEVEMKVASTGSGKPIQVSAESLQKAKSLMFECDVETRKYITDASGNVPEVEMKGFSTGSGKPIQVSAESLQKAKALMFEYDVETRKPITGTFPNEPEIEMKGFSTGSGKPIQVSAESLQKAKTLMLECNVETRKYITDASGNAPEVEMKGFSTLSGKPIQVSAESLQKAKTLMSEYEEGFKRKEESVFFLTGSGKTIGISVGALKKAEAFMKACDEKFDNPGTEEEQSIAFLSPLGNEKSCKSLEKAKVFWSKCESSFRSFPRAEKTETGNSSVKKRERMMQWNNPNNDERACTNTSTKALKVSQENQSKQSTFGIDDPDDWDEIVPNWLHAYATSPSIASDRINLSPVVSYEDGKAVEPEREYIVKSPILGLSDRFYGKRKKRKLHSEGISVFGAKASSKRTLDLDFSAPFKRRKFVEELDVKSERARARAEQEENIQEKQKVKPLKGSHLNKKTSEKQMNWMKATAGASPEVYSNEDLKNMGVRNDVLKICIENAASVRFNGEDFFGSECRTNTKGISTGDDCLLILDDDNRFGVEEIKKAFLASPGVQPNLLPPGWVENHYKWITWKLAHYERSFPRYFAGKALTPDHVLVQLKYRYDREIDQNERSAVRKILERDDTSIKRLVLCVCGIRKVSTGYELELTDGWYSCPARCDPAMERLIEKKKLCIGTKLMTQGATLVNCDQGVSPLEMTDEVYLKIATNSTRRIRWDTKLGFQKNPGNFPISLNSILAQGGPISRIDVIIVRIYPMLYMEKSLDGHHVTRNRKSEEKADAEYRKIQEQRIEMIYNEVQSEVSLARTDCKSKRNCDNDLSQLTSPDSSSQNGVSSQRSANERFSREVAEKIEKRLKQENLTKRNVSEFLRAKVVDFRKPDYNNSALLSVWNPNEDLISLLSEGKVISLLNVVISNSIRIYKPLQINTTRHTHYREITKTVKYPARKLTTFKNISSRVCPAFEEVDLVGMIVLIRDVSYGSRMSQVVYLTDLEMNFVGVVFWGSCKDYGWENALKIPSVVACSNLQWKKTRSTQDVPSLYVNENSVFTENPRMDYLREEIERLKEIMPKDITSFLLRCEENLTNKLEDSKWQMNISNNSSKDTSNLKDMPKPRQLANGFESKPTASSTPIKLFNANRGSNNSSEAEPSPIQSKIEKLQAYGEPPSLIPLIVRNNIKKKFRRKT